MHFVIRQNKNLFDGGTFLPAERGQHAIKCAQLFFSVHEIQTLADEDHNDELIQMKK